MHLVDKTSHNWLLVAINNEQVRKRLGLMKGRVYDLGCGTRPYEDDIIAAGATYVGVDWSNTLHGLRAEVVADLNRPLPIEDGAADIVVSFQVLEHLSEPLVMLSEALRILKPGGRIFLAVPFQWHVHEAPYDFFRYTNFGLKHLFGKAGFSNIHVEAVSGFWVTWALKFNYQTMRYIRGPCAARLVARGLLSAVWFATQNVARVLDRLDRNENETAGYFVSAMKPG